MARDQSLPAGVRIVTEQDVRTAIAARAAGRKVPAAGNKVLTSDAAADASPSEPARRRPARKRPAKSEE